MSVPETNRKKLYLNQARLKKEQIGSSINVGTRYLDLNQDVFVVEEIEIDANDTNHDKLRYIFIGVFDGHNILGEVAARKAGEELCKQFKQIAQEKWQSANTIFTFSDDEITTAFNNTNTAILNTYETLPEKCIYPVNGKKQAFELEIRKGEKYYSRTGEKRIIDYGTTATVALLLGNNQLIVASVGDTSCVIGREERNDIRGELLTRTHNVLNGDEVERIRTNFPNTQFSQDGYMIGLDESNYLEHHLAMTRAMGHRFMSKFGVIATPAIRRYTLSQKDFCLIVASDGVWDNVNEQEAVKFVADYEDATEAAKALVNHSLSLAEGVSDNTTAVVAFLQ